MTYKLTTVNTWNFYQIFVLELSIRMVKFSKYSGSFLAIYRQKETMEI